ncbi:hypothetical protein [Chryseobacterium sp. JUb7]|uniref:hypothetical protein n=1 Tax=Chryseobacterium sp. JUb7 TaxID=2940599 RepID=UPI0021671EE0|nr:hypothetical protein [Chryseobacterium sp. JUb7]MCS3532070.1 hypothetical protein [Chryseobacterium sp. JUb7]
MARKRRKIGFYYLTVNEGNDLKESFDLIISHINGLSKEERKYELGNSKLCYLDSYQETNGGNKAKAIIKSAKYSFRPNLVHRATITERENPKLLEEGEIEKSHIAFKFSDDAISFILDKHSGGITIKQFVSYLNQFSHSIETDIQLRFGFEIVVKEDFLQEIENLSRVTCANVVVDKQLLGSDALNYSDRITEVQHDIVVSVKAKKRDSIEEFAKDVFAKFIGGERGINRIRIIGRNEDNNQVVINTDFIERQEFIFANYNEITGEITSDDVFTEMYDTLNNFN